MGNHLQGLVHPVIKDISNDRKHPFCSNRKISIDNFLETISPNIAKEWRKTKNVENIQQIKIV